MEEGKLEADRLFKGLTRPPMILGVSFAFVMLNFFVTVIAFIVTSQFKFFLISFVLHGIGYVLCYDEPLFLELILKKMQKCSFCKNKIFYGGNSYDVR